MPRPGVNKSWEDAVEQAYRHEQVELCREYLREYKRGVQKNDAEVTQGMSKLEWARIELLRVVKEEDE